MADEVLSTVADGVATITLNRPDKRNAMNAALLSALRDCFDALDGRADVRVVVLRGAGSAFCAGMDLREMEARQGAPADGDAAVIPVILRALAPREGIAHDDLDALVRRARQSADASEGRRAMLEKRRPVFRGE